MKLFTKKQIKNLDKIKKEIERKKNIEETNKITSTIKNIGTNKNALKEYRKVRESALNLSQYLDEETINVIYNFERKIKKINEIKEDIKKLVNSINTINLKEFNPEVFEENMIIIENEVKFISVKNKIEINNVLSGTTLNKYNKLLNAKKYFSNTKKELKKEDLKQFEKIDTILDFSKELLRNNYLSSYDYYYYKKLRKLLANYEESNIDKYNEINTCVKHINKPALVLYYRFTLKQRKNVNQEVLGLKRYLKDYTNNTVGKEKIEQLKTKKMIDEKEKELEIQKELLEEAKIPTPVFNTTTYNEKEINAFLDKLNKKDRDTLCYMILVLEQDYRIKKNSLKISSKLFDICREREKQFSLINYLSDNKCNKLIQRLEKVDSKYADILGFNMQEFKKDDCVDEYAYIKVDMDNDNLYKYDLIRYYNKLSKEIETKLRKESIFGKKEKLSNKEIKELKRKLEIIKQDILEYENRTGKVIIKKK